MYMCITLTGIPVQWFCKLIFRLCQTIKSNQLITLNTASCQWWFSHTQGALCVGVSVQACSLAYFLCNASSLYETQTPSPTCTYPQHIAEEVLTFLGGLSYHFLPECLIHSVSSDFPTLEKDPGLTLDPKLHSTVLILRTEVLNTKTIWKVTLPLH